MTRRPPLHAAALLALALVAPSARAADDGPIEDNSFLIEEAYNQEPRVVQHIGTWMRSRGGGWEAGFTQEWPVGSRRHQLSYTIPAIGVPGAGGGGRGIGDVAIHYRYMGVGAEGGAFAAAPRVSLLLPTGDAARGRGEAGAGLQFNLPHSLALSPRWVVHANAGLTLVRGGEVGGPGATPATAVGARRTWHLGASGIWLVTSRLNLMLELLGERGGEVGDPDPPEAVTLAPGVRWSHDLANGLQVVPGVAVPIGLGPSRGERAVLLYLSLEHGF